jgi:hypothetical protein
MNRQDAKNAKERKREKEQMANFLSTVTILPWCKIMSGFSAAQTGAARKTGIRKPKIIRPDMMNSPHCSDAEGCGRDFASPPREVGQLAASATLWDIVFGEAIAPAVRSRRR